MLIIATWTLIALRLFWTWKPEGWLVASASRHLRTRSKSPLVPSFLSIFIPSSARRRPVWLALLVTFSEGAALHPLICSQLLLGQVIEPDPNGGLCVFPRPLPQCSEASESRDPVPALPQLSGMLFILSLGEQTASSCLKLS